MGMATHPGWRTPEQNDALVQRVLDDMARGWTMEEASARAEVPYETVRKIMTRYRRRRGYRTTCQMVAARTRETKP